MFTIKKIHFDLKNNNSSKFIITRSFCKNIKVKSNVISITKRYIDLVMNVDFDWNDDSGRIETIQYKLGKPYGSLPQDPVRDNYKFKGWYTDKISGSLITTDTVALYILKIYAQYVQLINLYFDMNGGTIPSGETVISKKYAPGYAISEYGLPDIQPKKDNLSFIGWNTLRDGTGYELQNTSLCPYGSNTYYAIYKAQSYTVNLNGQWVLSSSIKNPDPSKYDGVYMSNSNYHVQNSYAKMYIDIVGYNTFSFYIRSYAESYFDYVVVSELDQDFTSLPSSSSTTRSTYGYQQSGTSISSYRLITFNNIDGGKHRIYIAYRKDGSVDSDDDRGYVLIPKH